MLEQLLSLAYEANLPGLLAVALSATVGLAVHVYLSSGDA